LETAEPLVDLYRGVSLAQMDAPRVRAHNLLRLSSRRRDQLKHRGAIAEQYMLERIQKREAGFDVPRFERGAAGSDIGVVTYSTARSCP
jgi:hypothetical protein